MIGICPIPQIRQDVTQEHFYAVFSYACICIWPKVKNCPVPATAISCWRWYYNDPPLLVKCGRCCGRARIPGTEWLLSFQMRTQIRHFYTWQKSGKRYLSNLSNKVGSETRFFFLRAVSIHIKAGWFFTFLFRNSTSHSVSKMQFDVLNTDTRN